MREIKFRAIDWSFKKKWVYGHYFNGCVYPNSEDRNYIYSHDRSCWGYSDINELTLGQYTGLKDKNDVEIYEGDINQDNGVVVWNSDSASFCWDYKDVELMPFENESEWCVVVGNIHEPTDD